MRYWNGNTEYRSNKLLYFLAKTSTCNEIHVLFGADFRRNTFDAAISICSLANGRHFPNASVLANGKNSFPMDATLLHIHNSSESLIWSVENGQVPSSSTGIRWAKWMAAKMWNTVAVPRIAGSNVHWCFFYMHIDDGFVRSVHGALDTHSVSVVFHFIHYTPNAVSGSARHTNIARITCALCCAVLCALTHSMSFLSRSSSFHT